MQLFLILLFVLYYARNSWIARSCDLHRQKYKATIAISIAITEITEYSTEVTVYAFYFDEDYVEIRAAKSNQNSKQISFLKLAKVTHEIPRSAAKFLFTVPLHPVVGSSSLKQINLALESGNTVEDSMANKTSKNYRETSKRKLWSNDDVTWATVYLRFKFRAEDIADFQRAY